MNIIKVTAFQILKGRNGSIMKYALVNQTIATLRKEPAECSERVDEELYGMKVEIVSRPSPNWFYIKTSYHYYGYVHCSQLILDDSFVIHWDKQLKKVVLQAYADVLSIPKIQGHCFISLTRGCVISILEHANETGWVKVRLCDGRIGYMKEKYLGEYKSTSSGILNQGIQSEIEEEKLRMAIVSTALTYLGTQYRWGGRSPLGIDCSGLCHESYLLNGIIIYRDADIVNGFAIHEIPYEEMKKGDLLFFPGHVALYMGNSRYIHATAKNGSDGVVINSLNPNDKDYREDLPKSLKAVGSIF